MITSSAEVEALATTVEDNGGVYFVPAFSGLFAPYWKYDARGVIAGLTRYVNKGHIARAVLEATAWQTREVLDAMNADSGVALTALKVDGGMVFNDTPDAVPGRRPRACRSSGRRSPRRRPSARPTRPAWRSASGPRSRTFAQNWAKDNEWEPKMDAGRARQGVRALEEGRHADLRLGRARPLPGLNGQTAPAPHGAGASTSERGIP